MGCAGSQSDSPPRERPRCGPSSQPPSVHVPEGGNTVRQLLNLVLEALIPYVLVLLCLALIVVGVAYVEWGRLK